MKSICFFINCTECNFDVIVYDQNVANFSITYILGWSFKLVCFESFAMRDSCGRHDQRKALRKSVYIAST